MFGAYYVPMHAASTQDWLWPAFLFRCTSVTLVYSVVLIQRLRPRGLRGHWPVLIAIGLLDTGGNALFAAAAPVARPAQRRLGACIALSGRDRVARAARPRGAGAAQPGRRRAARARGRGADHSGRLETRCSIAARSSRTSSRQSPAGSGRFQASVSTTTSPWRGRFDARREREVEVFDRLDYGLVGNHPLRTLHRGERRREHHVRRRRGRGSSAERMPQLAHRVGHEPVDARRAPPVWWSQLLVRSARHRADRAWRRVARCDARPSPCATGISAR